MFHGKVSPEITEGLKELRKRIDAAAILSSKRDETLTLATWNVCEFGKKRPTEAAIHYIAEILGPFDVISIVERSDNLGVPAQNKRYGQILHYPIYDDGFISKGACLTFTPGILSRFSPARKASGDRDRKRSAVFFGVTKSMLCCIAALVC